MAARPRGLKAKRPRPQGRSRPAPTSASSASTASDQTTSTAHSAEDLTALDAFCAELACPASSPDAISIETWEHCHADLDLKLPLWLSAADAAAGGVRELCYSRSVLPEGGGEPHREKSRVGVLVPQGSEDGQRLVLNGLGDKAPDRAGDLIVTLRVKR